MSLAMPALAALPLPRLSAVAWEETTCLLCGGAHGSPLLDVPASDGSRFVVCQCPDCGLCFTNPRPSAASIRQFYPDEYRPYRAAGPRRASPWRWLAAVPSRRTDQRRRLLAGPGRGRLLDFGCGSGAFLEAMHRQGWQVTGIDPAAAVVEHVQAERGLSALAGTLPHPELRAARFDAITMWHSLEHVHAPLEVLREARRLLVPGGRLLVAVPNIDSLAFRWFGPSWHGLDLPRHLTHFAPWTLHLMLERAGFRVGPVRMLRHSAWMRWSARQACRDPQAPRWCRWLRAGLPSRLLATFACLAGQSDCMVVTAAR